MKRKAIGAALAAMVLSTFAYQVPAGAQSAPEPTPQKRETIYGYTMMSADERNDYREKMRNAKSEQERQALRDDHRKTMEARMRERGIEPGQTRGTGMGPRGPGMGPGGQGMGPGMGPGTGPGGPGAGPGARRGPPDGEPRGPGYGPRGPGAQSQ